MSDSSFQLKVENALAQFLAQSGSLPVNFRIISGHSAENLSRNEDGTPALKGDYLAIICGPPGGQMRHFGVSENLVELHLFTDINDSATREAQTASHGDRFGALLDLFAWGNFEAAKMDLNAIDGELGFSGWEYQEPAPGESDVVTASNQLLARPKYIFEVFLVVGS